MKAILHYGKNATELKYFSDKLIENDIWRCIWHFLTKINKWINIYCMQRRKTRWDPLGPVGTRCERSGPLGTPWEHHNEDRRKDLFFTTSLPLQCASFVLDLMALSKLHWMRCSFLPIRRGSFIERDLKQKPTRDFDS